MRPSDVCSLVSRSQIGYLTWIFFVDKSATTGSRPRPLSWIKAWRHVRDYFPISLTKTADLEPKRSYVFGCVPWPPSDLSLSPSPFSLGETIEGSCPDLLALLCASLPT